MDNLFIQHETMEKTASVLYMDKDSTKWVKQIIEHFLEQYPFLQDETILVDWKKKDDKKGYAVGVIKFLGAQVPVIIEDFNLYPLDVIAIEGQYYPLNQDTVKKLMTEPDAFGGTVASPPKDSNQLFNPPLSSSSFSPSDSYRSGPDGTATVRPAKTASVSVLDQISTVAREDVEEMMDTIDNDPAIKQSFEKNGTWDVIEKIANKSFDSPNSRLENFVRNLDVDRQYIYSDHLGNHFLKQANSELDKAWTTRISKDEARNYSLKTADETKDRKESTKLAYFPIKDAENEAIRIDSEGNWEKVAHFDEENAEIIDLPETETISEGDFVAILDESGITEPSEVTSVEKIASHEPIGSLNIINSRKRLNFNKEGQYQVTEGQDSDTKMVKTASDEDYIPNMGDFGIIASGGQCSEPFEVTKLQKTANQPTWFVEGFNGLQKHGFHITKLDFDGFKDHEEFDNHYYVPKTAQFIPLEENEVNDLVETNTSDQLEKEASANSDLEVTLSSGLDTKKVYYSGSNEGTTLEKTASGNYSANKDVKFLKLADEPTNFEKTAEIDTEPHYIGRDNAGFYYLKGREFEKYAENGHQLRDLDQDQAAWSIIHCNGPVKDLKKVANLDKNEVHPLDGKYSAPKSTEEVIEITKKAYSEEAKKIEALTDDLLKHASMLRSKSSVDAVLSLGLLRKHNVEEYLSAIPTYETVMSELAKLLLTSRLGLSQVPPRAVKKAMDSITKVLMMLKSIKSMLKEVN